ncbi:MAG: methionyl-tRNA formyltransferase [Deltaproteobacteria bacterium]|nr:methionyl-tRNA formyltransferase [Deltaproteobacteria bacterium]
MNSKCRIVFMGTPAFAAGILNGLLTICKPILVITQPDRPAGRGMKIKVAEAKRVAMEHNIEVFSPENINSDEVIEFISKKGFDLILVAAYGKILSQRFLDVNGKCIFNIHASLLPKYRGPAPINWAIINGDEKTGITFQKVVYKLDSGDIVLKREIPILREDNAEILHDKLVKLACEMLPEFIERFESGTLVYEKQDESLATYAPVLKKEDGRLDFNKSAIELFNRIRGLNPWPSTFTYYKGSLIKVLAADVYEVHNPSAPGTIIESSERGIFVATGEGVLIIKRLQKEGRNPLDVKDFLTGTRILPGERFD